jgi:hypothetical protein
MRAKKFHVQRSSTVQGDGKLNLKYRAAPDAAEPCARSAPGAEGNHHQRWDWPNRADQRRRSFTPEIIDAEYRVVRQRSSIGFGSCVFIIAVAAIIVLRFFWPPMIMLFAMLGVTSASGMLVVLVGFVIFGAAALHAKLSGKPF